MLKDDLGIGPISGTFPHVVPDDVAGAIDDEDRGRGVAIAQKIIDAIRIGHAVVGISQKGKRGVDELMHLVHVGEGSDGQSDNFRASSAKSLVLIAQLHELRAVRPSPAALDEDYNYRPFPQLLRQSERATSGPPQRKIDSARVRWGRRRRRKRGRCQSRRIPPDR